jgi:TPR repeat protein
MFRDGEGVLENNKTAYKWAKLAAAQGGADAQSLLGSLAGMDEDWIRSYMWLSLAIYNDVEEDVSLLKNIASMKMTPADIDTAQEMASRCLESGYTDCWMLPVQ